MPLFHCLHCGQSIDADDELVGLHVECPTCKKAIEVPNLKATVRISAPIQTAPPPMLPSATPAAGPPPLPPAPLPMPRQRTPYVPVYAEEEEPKRYVGWVLAATGMAAAMALFSTVSQASNAQREFGVSQLVESFGFFLGLAGIGLIAGLASGGVMAALKRGFVAPFQRTYAGTTIALTLFLAVGQLIQNGQRASSPSPITASPAASLPKMREATGSRDAPPSSIPSSSPVTANVKRVGASAEVNARRLEEIGSKLVADLFTHHTAYSKELEALNLDQLFRPFDMEKPEIRSKVIDNLELASKAIQTARESVWKRLDEAIQSTESSAIPEAQRPALKASLKKVIDDRKLSLNAYWDGEAKGLQYMESLVEIITSRRWKADEKGYVFDNRKDVETYNTKSHAMKAVMQGQDAKRVEAYDGLRRALLKAVENR